MSKEVRRSYERTRIARELHDIVAHAVSVIVVRAGAAEPIVEEDPVFVRQALGTIRTTGASALADMRRVVAMLRDAVRIRSYSPHNLASARFPTWLNMPGAAVSTRHSPSRAPRSRCPSGSNWPSTGSSRKR